MKKNSHILLSIALLLFFTTLSKAQVKEISLTLSPVADYTWWDDKAGLADNLFVGGKLGFGFGEYIELRGLYLQSVDQKTYFEDYGIAGYNESLFDAQNVKVTRIGGEFKSNFGTKGLSPYLTLGSGVQSIEVEGGDKFEQLYGSVGLGVKLNIAKRLVFSLEGKNTTYRFNSGVNLLSGADKTDFGAVDADFDNERLSNWSAQAGLQLYLGGRKPGTLSELDKAYLKKFKGGLRGLQWVIEPSLAYVDFAKQSLLRDTYMLGGYAGLDLNEYIGLRGFYFQSTENNEISTNFDKMAMYGGEFRARLNDGNGVTPLLTLGGGYLDPSNDYLSANNIAGEVKGSEFATAGLGMNIPLGKRVLITTGAKAMFTSGTNVGNIVNTNDIQTHLLYNGGIKFTLGNKSKSPTKVYQEQLDENLAAQNKLNDEKIGELKYGYKTKIDSLQNELDKAYAEDDVEKAIEILEKKKETKTELSQVEAVEKKVEKSKVVQQTTPATTTTPVQPKSTEKTLQMTPAEFESLIGRILEGVNAEPVNNQKLIVTPAPAIQNNTPSPKDSEINSLNKRVDFLENLYLKDNEEPMRHEPIIVEQPARVAPSPIMAPKAATPVYPDVSDKILEKLDQLERKIDANTRMIKQNDEVAQTILVQPMTNADTKTAITSLNNEGEIINNETIEQEGVVLKEEEPMLKFAYPSLIAGFNVGIETTVNLGFRLNYEINKTALEFMPEFVYGIGSYNTWALSGNVIYPVKINNENYTPYIGAGLGLGDLGRGLKGHYNIVIGTRLPFLNKNLFADYTMRNSFANNQIAVGYRLNF